MQGKRSNKDRIGKSSLSSIPEHSDDNELSEEEFVMPATTQPQPTFAEQDVKSSIASVFRTGFGTGYYKDAERMCRPGETDVSKISTKRGVGMEGCANPFVQSMQFQACNSWAAFIYLKSSSDSIVYHNVESLGGFHDVSYVLEQDSEKYILRLKGLSVTRNVLGGGVLLDSKLNSINMADKDHEIKTRDFDESISSYISTEIVFTLCNKDELYKFIKDNSPENEYDRFFKDNSPENEYDLFFKGNSIAGEQSFYKPEIRSAEYKVYVNPNFKRKGYVAGYNDPNKANYSGALISGNTDIAVIENSLDIRLEFVVGALEDALQVDDNNKDQHIRNALIDIRAFIDSRHINTKELLEHDSFKKFIGLLDKYNLNPENEAALVRFFTNNNFMTAIRQSNSAQSLFIALIKKVASPQLANGFSGLGVKFKEKLDKELNKGKIIEHNFWAGNIIQKKRFEDAEQLSKKFEAREHTMMGVGVAIGGCVLGVGFALGATTLAAATFGGVFILCGVIAYYCHSEKNTQKNNMNRICLNVSATQSDYFSQGMQATPELRGSATAIAGRYALAAGLENALMRDGSGGGFSLNSRSDNFLASK